MAKIIPFPKAPDLELYARKELGYKHVLLLPGQPRPGELWKRKIPGSGGPMISLITETTSTKHGIVVSFYEWGQGFAPLESFMEKRERIGWLGE